MHAKQDNAVLRSYSLLMSALKIPELNDVLVGEIAEAANWVVANLQTSISWPVTYEKYDYSGDAFFLIPLTHNHYPAVACKRGEETLPEARSKLLRFLSAMCWAESSGAIVASFTAGALPRPSYREKTFGHTITGDLALTYLPEATEPAQKISLGLMREGRGLNHPAYAFLSFYRVLEAAIPNGKARGQWITENLDAITDRGGLEALAKLRGSGIQDVGVHLYTSGRMAIAHAAADPIINPDDASDHDRIAGELPVMRGLAELAIEQVLGIKTRHTIYREHLYELTGWKDHIGADKVAAIVAGEMPNEGEVIDLPVIDIELRKRAPFAPLTGMTPVHAQQDGQSLILVYQSNDGLVNFGFRLDFAAERLVFDWQNDIQAHDDGSSVAASHAAELTRFVLEYVGNGELHIFDHDTRGLLSRVDAFIPVNYWANHEDLSSRVRVWHAKADDRRKAEATNGVQPDERLR